MKHQVWSTDNMKVEFFLPQRAGLALENKEWFDDSFPHAEVRGLFIWPLHKLPWFSGFSLPDAWNVLVRSCAPDQIDKKKEKEESFAEVSIMI